jgi:hypothetical protein
MPDRALSRAATTKRLGDVRTQLLVALNTAAEGLLLTPELVLEQQHLDALQQSLAAFEALMRATSTSNRGYEARDLPETERDLYARTTHALRVLATLHGPQAAP